jgi:outer membrane protein OmpA-like peptidoglycan-associated protein
MKRIKLNALAMFAIIAMILSGCGGVDKMKELAEGTDFKLTPNPLEVHGNMVKGTIEGTFPAKYFNKKAILEITPVIVYEGGELPLEIKMLQGQDVQDNHQSISFDAGGSFRHNIEFEYTDAMMKSDVELRFVIINKDKRIPFDMPQKIGAGVIATSKLVDLTPKPIMLKDKFQRIIPENKESQINFVIQRSDIRRTELTKDDVKALEDFIAQTAKEERVELKGIKVSAYASPDGPEKLNEKLSKERGKNTENWLGGVFKKAKVEGKPADYVSVQTTAEDWDGFQKLVQASDIQDKELILRVLSMYSDSEVREKEIKNLSKVYLVLAEKILPELRRSKMIANIEKIGYSDDELKEMVQSDNMDDLNVEEMLYAASLFEDNATQLKVYKKAADVHNDVRAHNNVGYIQLKNNNVADAKTALTAATNLEANNPVVKNNMGCVAMLEGNMDQAQSLFIGATNAGRDVKYNLGIIAIVKDQYPAAVEYLGGTDTFNQGLAMLLTNKNDAAKNTFQKVDEAKAFYGQAIVGARVGDENMVLNNLRTAIGKDASLKARAKKDMEFRNYFQNDAFSAIVQ